MLLNDDGNDEQLCCSRISCSGNRGESGLTENYSCIGDGKILKTGGEMNFCPSEGCTDEICCDETQEGNCTDYDNQYDCERMFGSRSYDELESVFPDRRSTLKKCLWNGDGGYYNSNGEVVNEKCSDYWNTPEGSEEYDRYHNKKSYIYGIDKSNRLKRCELPCEPQCLGTSSTEHHGETECPKIFEKENDNLSEIDFCPDEGNCTGDEMATGVPGYTSQQCLGPDCDFKEPVWEVYRSGVDSGGMIDVKDITQDNEYVYLLGNAMDTNQLSYFYRCKKPCGTPGVNGPEGQTHFINDISLGDGLEQLGLCDSASCDDMKIKSLSVSNEKLWGLTVGVGSTDEIYYCDKNKEIKTGDTEHSCLKRKNWIRMEITPCSHRPPSLPCGRYIGPDPNTIKINKNDTEYDLYDNSDENYYNTGHGLNRGIQHTNDHIYGIVMSGNINQGEYNGISGDGTKDIGLIGRVDKGYLHKQYHYGMEVNWEGVGGPKIAGKVKPENVLEASDRIALNNDTATCSRFYGDTDAGVNSLLSSGTTVANPEDICGWDAAGYQVTKVGWSRISVWDNYDTGPQKPRRVDGGNIIHSPPETHFSGDNGLTSENIEQCPALIGLRDTESDDNYGVHIPSDSNYYIDKIKDYKDSQTFEDDNSVAVDWSKATISSATPTRCWVYGKEKNGNYLKCSDLDAGEECNNAVYINSQGFTKDGYYVDNKRKERTHGVCESVNEECQETQKEIPDQVIPHTLPCSDNNCDESRYKWETEKQMNMPSLTDKWGNCHKDWGNGGLGWGPLYEDPDVFGDQEITRGHIERKHTVGSLTNQLPYCREGPGQDEPIPECIGEQISTYPGDLNNSCRDFDNNLVCNGKYIKHTGTYSDGTEYTNYYQCGLDNDGLCLPGISEFGYTGDSVEGYNLENTPELGLIDSYKCSKN